MTGPSKERPLWLALPPKGVKSDLALMMPVWLLAVHEGAEVRIIAHGLDKSVAVWMAEQLQGKPLPGLFQ